MTSDEVAFHTTFKAIYCVDKFGEVVLTWCERSKLIDFGDIMVVINYR